MKPKVNPLFFIYQWFVAFPVMLVITVFAALFTIVFSPFSPNSNFVYAPVRWWGRMFCYVVFIRVKITGIENIDPKQSYIIAGNHQSWYDIFVLYGWLPVIFKWIMKAELHKIPLIGKACDSAGHIFMNRSNPIEAKKSLEKAEQQLQHGVSVVIFPEGTRTYSGKLQKFKRGAFHLATDLQLPILPFTIKGSFHCMPRTTFNVKPGLIEVQIHRPIDVKPYLPDHIQELIQTTWNDINSAL